jgi:Na+/phosphate symporter
VVYRSHKYHKRKETDKADTELQSITDENIVDKSMDTILISLGRVVETFDTVISGLKKEDIKKLKKARKTVSDMTEKAKYLKDHINDIVEKLREDSIESGYYFVQVVDYLREMVHSIEFIVKPALKHVDNNHKPLKKEQIKELVMIYDELEKLIKEVARSVKFNDFTNQDEIVAMIEEYRNLIEKIRKNQIKRVKNNKVGTKNSILFLDIINEVRNLGFQVVNLYKSQRDFVMYKRGNG